MIAALFAGIALNCAGLPGFVQEGPNRTYDADSLFEYMNGNSEGYLVYGFVKMNGITCAKGAQKVLIDVSEMKDEESAYGLFTSNRDIRNTTEPIGAAGQVVPRKAVFVKGRYFVELAAEDPGDHSDLLRAGARTLERSIEGTTATPQPIAWFPSEGLAAGPPRLVPESVLGIRTLKRGYMAQYAAGKAFVVSEDSPDSARAVMEKLRTRFGSAKSAAGGDEAFEVTDQYLGRMCVIRRGSRIVGYAGVPESQDPLALSKALLSRVP